LTASTLKPTMTTRFSWHANVLRGPFRLLAGKKFVLPPSPPESAPFDSSEW